MQRVQEESTSAELASVNAAARERVEKLIAGVRELEKRIGPSVAEVISVDLAAPDNGQGVARERAQKLIAGVRELEKRICLNVAEVTSADPATPVDTQKVDPVTPVDTQSVDPATPVDTQNLDSATPDGAQSASADPTPVFSAATNGDGHAAALADEACAQASEESPEAAPAAESTAAIEEPAVVTGQGFPALFDRLRSLSASAPGGSIVVAPASDAFGLTAAIGTLTRDAERARLRTLVMSSTAESSGLVLEITVSELDRQRRLCREVPAALRSPVSWNPTAAGGASAVGAVIAEARRLFDLLVIVGPPLSASADSAHLARACDGLVIVAQAQSTTKDELRAAADNARIAACSVLGIVVAQPSNWLTELMRRF